MRIRPILGDTMTFRETLESPENIFNNTRKGPIFYIVQT